MRLEARIAWRYLWKKKSHGAVGAIAVVSVVGVAVATAALVCVLSVFNGFREVLTTHNDRILPDIEVTPVAGKVISQGDSLADVVAAIPGVEIASPVVVDQALALFEGREMPVMLRGIDPAAFRRMTLIDSLIVDGSPLPADPMAWDPPAGLISVGVAARLRAVEPGSRILLFAPRRQGRINLANPAMSFFTDSIGTAGIFETLQSDYDASSVIVPIEVARGIFQYDGEATSVAVSTTGAPGDLADVRDRIAERIGPDYRVRDRRQQQELSFRMVEIEKWVTGLLLLFILVIASFNIISTMTMFVLEKRRGMRTLNAIGLSGGRIGAIFGWESIYITLAGGLAGIAVGIGLCLLQQHFGLLRMQGGEALILQAYPVRLLWSDPVIAFLPILMIGLFTSWIASAFARSRISEKRQ